MRTSILVAPSTGHYVAQETGSVLTEAGNPTAPIQITFDETFETSYNHATNCATIVCPPSFEVPGFEISVVVLGYFKSY